MGEQEREVASKAAGYLPPAPGMYMQGPTGPGPMYMPQHYPGMMPPGGPMYPGQGYQVHQGPPGGDQQQQQQSGPSMGGQPGMGGQGPTPGPVMGGQGPSTGPDQGQTFNMSAMSASLPPQQQYMMSPPQQQQQQQMYQPGPGMMQPQQQMMTQPPQQQQQQQPPAHPQHQQIPQPEAPSASLISFD